MIRLNATYNISNLRCQCPQISRKHTKAKSFKALSSGSSTTMTFRRMVSRCRSVFVSFWYSLRFQNFSMLYRAVSAVCKPFPKLVFHIQLLTCLFLLSFLTPLSMSFTFLRFILPFQGRSLALYASRIVRLQASMLEN